VTPGLGSAGPAERVPDLTLSNVCSTTLWVAGSGSWIAKERTAHCAFIGSKIETMSAIGDGQSL
jgi:hypothetical protein